MLKKNNRLTVLSYIFLFVLSSIFVYYWSFTTSPHYPIPYSGDSPFFLTIGKYWSRGLIPYIDLWDQKGPIIFFMNMLGWSITDSRSGVFLVQIISLFITAVVLQRFFKTKYNVITSTVLVAFFLAGIMQVYQWGNTVEEYLLPWMSLGFFFQYTWIKKAEKGDLGHDPRYAFYYGVVGAYCFWSRATNALPIFAGCMIIVAALLINKKYHSVLLNLLAAGIGFFVFTLPIIVYFASKHALSDLWFGTIQFNLAYAESSATSAPAVQYIINEPLKYLICYGNALFIVLSGLYNVLITQKRLRGFFYIAIGILPAAWLLTSMGYQHYGMILAPLFPILVLELSDCIQHDEKAHLRKLITLIPLTALLLLQLYICRYAIHDYRNSYLKDEPTKSDCLVNIFNMIPEDEKNSFIAYNGSGGTYLLTDAQPLLPVFSFQDWYSTNSPEWGAHIHSMYDSSEIRWILTREAVDQTCGIQDILDTKYDLVYQEVVPYTGNTYYYLYRLKN